MKKQLLIILVLIITFGCLFGCGKSEEIMENIESNSNLSPELEAAYKAVEEAKAKVYAPNHTVFADDSKMYELYRVIDDGAAPAINDLCSLTRADISEQNSAITNDIEDVKELIIFYYEQITDIYEEAYSELTADQKPIQIHLENFREALEIVKTEIDEGRVTLGVSGDVCL